MTRYEVGFMNKCAEYGLAADEAVGLMKQAIGGLTGFLTQYGNPKAPDAATGGKRGILPGALTTGGINAIYGLADSPRAALLYGAGGGLYGALAGYLGGRLAGHYNEKKNKGGKGGKKVKRSGK